MDWTVELNVYFFLARVNQMDKMMLQAFVTVHPGVVPRSHPQVGL